MSLQFKNLVLAAAFVAAVPAVSQAATVIETNLIADQFFTGAEVLEPGNALEFRFTALEAFTISGFSLSGTGNNATDDLEAVSFGFVTPTTEAFSTFLANGTVAFAGGFLPGAGFAAGDMFSVFFSDGIDHPVSLTLSFSTQSISAVPLPASALMLGSALMAAFARFRRKAKQIAAGSGDNVTPGLAA